MKKFYTLSFLFLVIVTQAQIVNIPDAIFKAKLLQASSTNTIASSQSPVYNSGSWSVPSYNSIDTNNDGEIQVTEAQAIKWLTVTGSNISDLTGIAAFTNLQYLTCYGNQLTSLNVSSCSNLGYLGCNGNQLTSLNVSGCTNLQQLYCTNNQLTTLNVSGLTNLKSLNCDSNQLTTLNVSGCTNLFILYCSGNQLTSLNVSGLTNLVDLYCSGNQLTTLNVSGCTNLQQLYCTNNQLTTLNVSGLTNLEDLYCYQNQLTSLNVSGCTNLTSLNCDYNNLTTLNLSGFTNLGHLSCGYNQLTTLNISGCPYLNDLDCSNNQLTTLFIKNGNIFWAFLNYESNPNLNYICADEEDLILVQNKINQYGIGSTCNVNSYCSFTPGGTFYTINGNNRLDSNNNGCDASDGVYRNFKINITNGIQSGSLIANEAGNYSIPVQAGTHTLTPVFENPSYFNVSPATATVSFPAQSSPFVQNFCITANGVHHDVEVTVVPIGVARPGFNAYYKIIYKNKGNQIENTSLTFGYNDTVMDFINASVATTSQVVGQLSWNIDNLAPLQSGTITVSFNLNTPWKRLR